MSSWFTRGVRLCIVDHMGKLLIFLCLLTSGCANISVNPEPHCLSTYPHGQEKNDPNCNAAKISIRAAGQKAK